MFVRCRWTGLWELLKMNNNKSRIYSSSDCVGLKIITYVLLSIRAFISSKGWKNSVSYSTVITWRAFAYQYDMYSICIVYSNHLKPSIHIHPFLLPFHSIKDADRFSDSAYSGSVREGKENKKPYHGERRASATSAKVCFVLPMMEILGKALAQSWRRY